MLRKVAYFMQFNKKDTSGNLISKSDLENILTESLREIVERGEPRMIARVIIEELRNRNFILCYLGADSYGFVHRTFLEYFCAWEFVWQFKEDQTLTIERLINEVFGAHWQDESWHEVLRLICGMIEPKFVADIIDFLLEQKINKNEFIGHILLPIASAIFLKKEALANIILATNCLGEVRNKSLIANTSERLRKTLIHEIEQNFNPQFEIELVVRLMTSIAQGWKEHPYTLPWLKNRALQDGNWDVRQAAVNAIAEGWKEYPDTLPLLKDRALLDESQYVRQAAWEAITQNWKKDPDTLPWLKKRALQDEYYDVRQAAVEAIAEGWKEDPDTLPFLKNRALQDEHFSVRQAAVNAIAKNWKEDPDTLPWLKNRALQDKDNDVRQVTVTAIAQGWKEDLDTLPWLKNYALQKENYYVRQAAVNAIIENGQEDPELIEFLANIALSDPFKRKYDQHINPRQTALEGLLENFGDNPKTLEILNQVARNDSDGKLREFAQEKLKEWEY